MSERPSALRRFFIREGKLHPLWRSILYILAYFLGLLTTQTPVFALYALLPMAAGMPGQEVMERLAPEALPLTILLAAKALEMVMLFLFTYLFRRFLDKRSFVTLGFVRRPGWLADIGWGIGLGLILLTGIFLVEWGGGWLTMKGFVWESQPLASALATLSGYFLLFIMVGISEELIFRGYLLSNLQEWRGTVMAVTLSSLLFGLFHSLNPHFSPLALIHLVLAGAVFCYAYLITENLWLPIAFHFSWNFFQGPVFSFPVSGLPSGGLLSTQVSAAGTLATGGSFGPEGGLIGLGALFLSALLLRFWSRRKNDRG